MPTDDFTSLSVLIWIPVAVYVATAIHELSHALAARLAGLRVAACGIGFAKPLLKARLFGCVFYQTRSPLGGLTYAYSAKGLESRRAVALMIAAGPLADLSVTAGALILWRSGYRAEWVAPTFYVGAIFLLADTVPMSMNIRRMRIDNDGRQLLHALLGRQPVSSVGMPQLLHSVAVMRDFYRRLDAWPVTVRCTLAAAACQASLGDREGAEESLRDECLSDPRRGEAFAEYESVIRAVIAVAAIDESAPAALDEAEAACAGHPELSLEFRLMRAAYAADAGDPDAGHMASQVREEAERRRQYDVAVRAESLCLRLSNPEDPLKAYREFAARRPARRPTPFLRMHVAGAMAARLAERGEREPARQLFHETLELARSAAAAIPWERTRRRFLSRFAHELARTAAKLDDPEDVPLYVDLRPPAPVRRSLAWAWGLLAGFALALGCIAVIIVASDPRFGIDPSEYAAEYADMEIRYELFEAGEKLRLLNELRDGDSTSAVEALEEELRLHVEAVEALAPNANDVHGEALHRLLEQVRDYRERNPQPVDAPLPSDEVRGHTSQGGSGNAVSTDDESL